MSDQSHFWSQAAARYEQEFVDPYRETTDNPLLSALAAITNARLSRLVFGAADPRAGAVGSLWDVVRDQRLTPVPEVISGVLADECLEVIRQFFIERR